MQPTTLTTLHAPSKPNVLLIALQLGALYKQATRPLDLVLCQLHILIAITVQAFQMLNAALRTTPPQTQSSFRHRERDSFCTPSESTRKQQGQLGKVHEVDFERQRQRQ
jgi:hypothetical protein